MENTKTYGEIYIEDLFIKHKQKAFQEGYQIGFQEGYQKGYQKAKLEVVKNMLNVCTNEQISIFTQLPVDKIVEIRKNSIDLM